MRSAIERLRRAAWRALLLTGLLTPAIAPAADAERLPSREQVKAAVTEVARDPDLPGLRTEREWRFKKRDKTEPKPEKDKPLENNAKSGWDKFMEALSSGARLLVWGLGAAALAWFVWRLRHWLGWRADARAPRRRDLPSHVGVLDIRPDSLPAAVGPAAAELWRRGESRAAMSLLYRGTLSRLVHTYAVPIRGASTEDECLTLARPLLAPNTLAFVAELIDAWRIAAYAGRLPDGTQVLALCQRFDAALTAASEMSQPTGAAMAGVAP